MKIKFLSIMKSILILIICYQIALVLNAQVIKKIDVGGHKIDVRIKSAGPVPVVFEAGLTKDLTTWESVFNVVGTFSTAVAYSRAGYGDSEEGPLPRTPNNIFKDFNALIDSLNLNNPIILVGHSLGGFLVRYYTKQIPERIGGLVLVDAMHEARVQKLLELDSLKWGKVFGEDYDKFKDSLKIAKAYSESVFSEWDVTDNIRGVERGMGGADFKSLPLPDIPIVVLTAIGGPYYSLGEKNALRELHAEWIKNSSNVMWIITDRSGHEIQADQPDLVINAVEFINNILLADKKAE